MDAVEPTPKPVVPSDAVRSLRTAAAHTLRAADVPVPVIARALSMTPAGVYYVLGPEASRRKPATRMAPPPLPETWLADFAKGTRDFRLRNGLTQHDLAVLLRISHGTHGHSGSSSNPTISAWETGQSKPPTRVAVVYMLSDLERKWKDGSLSKYE